MHCERCGLTRAWAMQTAAVTPRAGDLLAGPRGRRMCLELLRGAVGRTWPELSWTDGKAGYPVGRFDPEQARRSLAAAVAALDVAALVTTQTPATLLPALTASVDRAMYWQEPDEVDQLLAQPALGAELVPVAEAVVQAPASQWWAEPMAATDQHAIAWAPDDPPVLQAPNLTGAGPALQRWREQTAADEQQVRRERPADPRAPWSGAWWSTPALVERIVTTRTLPGAAVAAAPAPVGLTVVEDEMGWTAARSWPVHVPGDARVLELTGPGDWAALVQRYPLEVTASRRHDWWRVTGWNGAWVIPDWAAVAVDVDAVHLTVDGYLSTAGRALPVDVPALGRPARTLLGGWDPDATWWFTDAPTGLGEATDWRRQAQDAPWAAARRRVC
jgi:hypothetical protein